MLRLVSDRSRYRWGDPITVRYEGDLDDLGTWTNVRGTMQVADSPVRVPFAGDLTFGAGYAPPLLPGYKFEPDAAAAAAWVGLAVEDRPRGMRTATIVGAVTTLRGTATVSCTVDIVSPMAVGWAPGRRVGESDVDAVRRMLADYPTPSAVRIFAAAGDGLPSWTSGVLAAIPDTVRLVVLSIKDWPVDVAAWLTAMPAKFAGRLVFVLDHEPEQQSGGDPTPVEFRAEWAELVAALRDHPRRGEILLALVFTRYYWARNPGAFDDFMPTDALSGVDVIGWDVYDPATSGPYETPESALAVPTANAARTGKPWMLCEVGIRRRTWDVTGDACAAAMRAWHDASADAGCLGWMWFHRGDHDLTARGRDAERDKLAGLITGAA